ncbi:EamA family transporter [Longimicrobium sp.]|uniref:EamA family transporter n=1 Tax=Longimicrobium sp. TaxID=2029185 RepID=UPI002E2F4158|nr:EamA family transporter [Longimicrobium sp.]HEX6037846.1 EamA family transporter [Longimicrobium sp.]
MWIGFALVAAIANAGTSFSLKRAVEHGGAVVSTFAARMVASLLLLGLVAATGAWHPLTPAYWRAVSLVLVPEVMGTICLTLALRRGDLSLVQPIMGLLPGLVMLGAIVFLDERPSPEAGFGVALVTLGVYCVGLQGGGSLLEPLRALGRSRANWFAVASAVSWSLATLVHKRGIAAVGPFPWAATLAFVAALGMAVVIPFLAWRTRAGLGMPEQVKPWSGFVAFAGLAFAVQQMGLHTALRLTQTGYVIALTSTSILWATALGILVLRERAAARTRAAGALLVSGGATLIALFG